MRTTSHALLTIEDMAERYEVPVLELRKLIVRRGVHALLWGRQIWFDRSGQVRILEQVAKETPRPRRPRKNLRSRFPDQESLTYNRRRSLEPE
jgi:hypothetical protein